ncbi:double-stranded RNA-binding protein 2-like isoform X2 [Cornus florida]|nr:double-stranded RNA-binding protein 2-like isoform X2 [Cornus florida]
MYKSQLQELAQRSCFNLPSYACIREGPDHAPRFKACVNFNGELFESPTYCTTLRKAEHAAAEVALNVLSTRGPSRSLTARILDETGVYKNLLQETAHRTGLNLPVYTTIRSGPGHAPVFTSTVELAGMNFTGESAKTKKQAEKNAAIAAWCSLKKMPNLGSMCHQTNKETDIREEQDQAVVARILSNFRPREEKKPNRPRRDDQIQNQTRGGGILNRDHHHLWRRPMDLLMDSFSEGPEQKQNSFVSLLPPPPPRTSSKILQTTSSRDTSSSLYYQYSSDHSPSSIVTGQCQSQVVKKQEVAVAPPLALDEHQKDEDEWLSGKSSSDHVMKEDSGLGPNSIMYRQAFSLANYSGRSRLVGTPSTSPMPIMSSSIKCSPPTCSNYIGIGGGYKYNPQRRIAPAVQIRSVIPVCATPSQPAPAPAPAVRPPQPSMKEAAATTSMSTTHGGGGGGGGGGEGAEVVSSASPRFNKLLQVNTTQLSSDFNNKLHLSRN